MEPIIGPAVVPVFVNAGAALLPAILAGIASVVALIFKPRELARVCVSKPHIPLLLIAIGVGGYFLVSWLMTPLDVAEAAGAPAGRRASQAVDSKSDWAKVAIEILRQEERAKIRAEAALAMATPEAAPVESAPAVKRSAANDIPSEPNEIEPAITPAEPAATDSPRATIYRGDVSRCGYGGGPSPVNLAPLWEFAEDETMYLSSPIVVGDRVFGASCYLDPPGSYGAVICLDAATGEEQWYTDIYDHPDSGAEIELKGFFSSPAVSADGKYLVIGQGLHSDANCQLICLNAEDGSLNWMVETPLHIEGSPAIDGDLVVAGAGAIEDPNTHLAVGDPGYVFCVRLSDGKQLWKHAINDPESSPAIADGVAYIGSGFNGRAVVALRTESDDQLQEKGLDRVLWKTDTPHPATGTVTLTDDLVLIGCGNADYVLAAKDPEGLVLALDRTSGEIRWQVEMPDAVLGAIAARDGKAICPVRNGELVAIDLGNQGEVLWRTNVNKNTPVMAGPAFTGTHVYAATQDGYLAILDADNGKVIETLYINAKDRPGEQGLSTSSPMVVGGRVYVGSETGGLRCLAGRGGQ